MGLSADMVKDLPKAPGVYLMRDSSGKIIYIGKAKEVRSRVRSYLTDETRPFARTLFERVDRVDYVLTRNETEALLLENQLIKAHKPRYNIDLKDDKTYVRIKVTTSAEWPALSITRKVLADGSRYFGPYSSAQATRKTLSAIGRIFPVRRCKDTEFANRSRPCIYHQIGVCMAPCVYKAMKAEYAQAVSDLAAFLEGRDRELEKVLTERMKAEAARQNFEKAAEIRDQIAAIATTLIPQAVVGHARGDTHVFGTFRSRTQVQVAVLCMTRGTVTDSHDIAVKEMFEEDFLTSFILQFYLSGNEIPQHIYTDALPLSRDLLEEVLTSLKGSRVKISKASRGKPLQWMAIARENALNHARGKDASVLEEIAKAFHLRSIPYRIECYDISSFQGSSATASRAVFVDGLPEKSLYRHYRIRTIDGQDDFAMLREVFERRLSRDETRPDLLVIDGGKGQLNVFVKVIRELGAPKIPLVAMAKARQSSPDRFFLPGRKDAVRLPERSRALRTLQQIRDEAHRFAVKYHRQLRSRTATSGFEEIPGIGPRKAKTLLMHTAHLPDLSRITPADLEGVRGLTGKDIENILAHFGKTG